MTRTQAILLTLITYKVVLVLIGLWASRRTRDDADFFIGGRRLGPVVAAISASASSSSAWTLLSVSGMACLWGLPALWLFPATLSGFLINWFVVGPRLWRQSGEQGFDQPKVRLEAHSRGGPDPLLAQQQPQLQEEELLQH